MDKDNNSGYSHILTLHDNAIAWSFYGEQQECFVLLNRIASIFSFFHHENSDKYENHRKYQQLGNVRIKCIVWNVEKFSILNIFGSGLDSLWRKKMARVEPFWTMYSNCDWLPAEHKKITTNMISQALYAISLIVASEV